MSQSTLPVSTQRSSLSRPRAVLAMLLMGATLFITITFEMLPIGLISILAEALGTSEQGAGLLISIYSVVVVIGSIPLSAAVARYNARMVLLILLVIFALSAMLLALSTSLMMALVARLIGGAAHAILHTCAFRIALAVVPPRRQSLAASTVSAGNALALSFGVPAATALGASVAWQLPFAVTGSAFLALAALTILVVPSRIGQPKGGMSARRTLAEAKKLPLLRVGLTITLVILAHFTTYSYVEPLLLSAGVPSQNVSAVLLGFGVASVAGLLLVSFVAERYPAVALRIAIGLVAVSLGGIWLAHQSALAASIMVILWGLTFGALPVLLQTLALRATSHLPEASPPVVNTTFNIGITLGALLGGQIVALGVPATTSAISALMLCGILILTLIPRWLPQDGSQGL